MKLNLGSKYRKLPGFDNLDKIFGWRFQQGLPAYKDNEVDGITISHALMFLTEAELVDFLKEAWRVLRIGGVIRITEDDTESPKSEFYQTGNLKSGPASLTGPKMMRQLLENAGFKVYDVNRNTTYFTDHSLMQAYRGGPPKVFFIEGVKDSNLLEQIKILGHPYEIPDSNREDLPRLFVDLGLKTGAEIGVEKGWFSERLCRVGLKLYSIDPWQTYPDLGYSNWNQNRLDFLYEHTKRTLANYPNSTIIRKFSMDAVNDFADESLDFVYIDANHEFKYIAQDLVEWTKKVRKGGVVSGHDYFFSKRVPGKDVWQVGYVVRAFVAAYSIPNFYVLGSKNPLPGEKRDKWRSWMFIKP